MSLNNLSYTIIGKAIEVHRILGPGLLEKTYKKCLAYELREAGLIVEEERQLPVSYKGIVLEQAYRIDIIVNQCIVIELKSVGSILPVHEAQILTYMKLGGFELGLLINFNTTTLIKGMKRFINSKSL